MFFDLYRQRFGIGTLLFSTICTVLSYLIGGASDGYALTWFSTFLQIVSAVFLGVSLLGILILELYHMQLTSQEQPIVVSHDSDTEVTVQLQKLKEMIEGMESDIFDIKEQSDKVADDINRIETIIDSSF